MSPTASTPRSSTGSHPRSGLNSKAKPTPVDPIDLDIKQQPQEVKPPKATDATKQDAVADLTDRAEATKETAKVRADAPAAEESEANADRPEPTPPTEPPAPAAEPASEPDNPPAGTEPPSTKPPQPELAEPAAKGRHTLTFGYPSGEEYREFQITLDSRGNPEPGTAKRVAAEIKRMDIERVNSTGDPLKDIAQAIQSAHDTMRHPSNYFEQAITQLETTASDLSPHQAAARLPETARLLSSAISVRDAASDDEVSRDSAHAARAAEVMQTLCDRAGNDPAYENLRLARAAQQSTALSRQPPSTVPAQTLPPRDFTSEVMIARIQYMLAKEPPAPAETNVGVVVDPLDNLERMSVADTVSNTAAVLRNPAASTLAAPPAEQLYLTFPVFFGDAEEWSGNEVRLRTIPMAYDQGTAGISQRLTAVTELESLLGGQQKSTPAPEFAQGLLPAVSQARSELAECVEMPAGLERGKLVGDADRLIASASQAAFENLSGQGLLSPERSRITTDPPSADQAPNQSNSRANGPWLQTQYAHALFHIDDIARTLAEAVKMTTRPPAIGWQATWPQSHSERLTEVFTELATNAQQEVATAVDCLALAGELPGQRETSNRLIAKADELAERLGTFAEHLTYYRLSKKDERAHLLAEKEELVAQLPDFVDAARQDTPFASSDDAVTVIGEHVRAHLIPAEQQLASRKQGGVGGPRSVWPQRGARPRGATDLGVAGPIQRHIA